MQEDSLAIPLALACATLADAGPLETATGTPGIDYGMSKDEVLARLEGRHEIREVGECHILAIGMWDLLEQPSRKTFEFEDGVLSSISYSPLPGAP